MLPASFAPFIKDELLLKLADVFVINRSEEQTGSPAVGGISAKRRRFVCCRQCLPQLSSQRTAGEAGEADREAYVLPVGAAGALD